MLSRIETGLRRCQRLFSRSEWLARLLKLSVSTEPASKTGLVMLQIDGLSHNELKKALACGEMPFLQKLVDSEHYQLHSIYSGVPSTTPAAQGELFYGLKSVVPGFNFKPHDSDLLVRMFEPTAVTAVETHLQSQCQQALLARGSCYADNFSGGAAEPHFCPSSLGWGNALRDTRPLILLTLIVSHLYSFMRCIALILIELVLAIVDFTRGLFVGNNFWAELKFIPSRVLIVILLRELATIGVKIDVARGLPIIHANFLGYDEQAHRRGPTSLFAHWTLLGIDDAIARIWRAIQRASRRSYDLWIYSDHGQEDVTPYQRAFSTSFAEAACKIFKKHLDCDCDIDCQTTAGNGIQLERIRMLGGKLTQTVFARLLANLNHKPPPPPMQSSACLSVASLGPVAQLYFNQPLTTFQLSTLARALCIEAGVAAVLYLNSRGVIRVRRPRSEYNLHENAAALVGTEHTWPDMVYEDLKRLCTHPDAGVLIACGQYPENADNSAMMSLSFALENGAHGGWSSAQIDAFALLPNDIALQAQSGGCPRVMDLRHAVLDFLESRKTPDLKNSATSLAGILE